MHRTSNRSMSSALAVMPRRISEAIERIGLAEQTEEIRLRVSRPPQIITSRGETLIETAPFSRAEALELLEGLCRHSVYAWAEELRNGYITLEGGARVGLCGRPVVENGRIIRLTEATCFNIRIAREAKGCAEPVMPYLADGSSPLPTLIASPPSGGKTTLLRDIARCFSDGIGIPHPVKVAIADERNELSGCVDGIPSFDVGNRTDIMESAPKAESIFLFIRSMSPSVIVTDEIGDERDAAAAAEAARCGVAVIASAHANGMEELMKRKCTGDLLRSGVFRRVLLLKRDGSRLKITPVST